MEDLEKKKLANQRAKEHYEKNKEAKKAYSREYAKRNRDKIREKHQVDSEWNILNRKRASEYYYKNKNTVLEKAKTWRSENKHKKKIQDKEYALKNPEKLRANKAKRKKAVRRATPKWLTKEQIVEIEQYYLLAIQLEEQTGIEHQVDHIVPIQGKNVCGLHVPWNLQVLTWKENREKSNKFND